MTRGLVKEFGKAQVSSLIATSFDFGVTAIVFRLLDHVVASTASGAIAGGIVNCVINYVWTFKGSQRSKTSVALRYVVVWTGSVLLNTFGTEFGVKAVTRIGSLLGNDCVQNLTLVLTVKAVVAVLVAVLWNFTMQKLFVYRKRSNQLTVNN